MLLAAAEVAPSNETNVVVIKFRMALPNSVSVLDVLRLVVIPCEYSPHGLSLLCVQYRTYLAVLALAYLRPVASLPPASQASDRPTGPSPRHLLRACSRGLTSTECRAGRNTLSGHATTTNCNVADKKTLHTTDARELGILINLPCPLEIGRIASTLLMPTWANDDVALKMDGCE